MKIESAEMREPCNDVKEGGVATKMLRKERWSLEIADGCLFAREKDGKLRLVFPLSGMRRGVLYPDPPVSQKGKR